MVFEEFYSSEFLNRNKPVIFIVSLAYTAFGIGTSFLLFREFNQSLVSLALISLMLLATFKDILKISIKSSLINKKHVSLLFREYKDNIIIFSYIFAGILIGFSFFSMLLPSLASQYIFNSQYNLLVTNSAQQIFLHGNLNSIFFNNLSVLLVSLITSFLFGIGTVFLFIVVWNASVIGVIFGEVAKQTATNIDVSAFIVFLVIIIASLPHIIFEISAYLLSGMAGENFSNNLIFRNNEIFSHKRLIVFSAMVVLISIILIFIGTLLEISFPSFFIGLFI